MREKRIYFLFLRNFQGSEEILMTGSPAHPRQQCSRSDTVIRSTIKKHRHPRGIVVAKGMAHRESCAPAPAKLWFCQVKVWVTWREAQETGETRWACRSDEMTDGFLNGNKVRLKLSRKGRCPHVLLLLYFIISISFFCWCECGNATLVKCQHL